MLWVCRLSPWLLLTSHWSCGQIEISLKGITDLSRGSFKSSAARSHHDTGRYLWRLVQKFIPTFLHLYIIIQIRNGSRYCIVQLRNYSSDKYTQLGKSSLGSPSSQSKLFYRVLSNLRVQLRPTQTRGTLLGRRWRWEWRNASMIVLR